MAQTDPNTPRVLDEDAKLDFLAKKQHRKYKAQVRKFRRDAENDNSELNLTAMMDMMTILLVFLIKSYGATQISVAMNEDLTPPTSTITLQPVETMTTVTITRKDVSVAEKGVVKLSSEMKIPKDSLDDEGFMPAVKDALEREVANTASVKGRVKDAPPDKDPAQMLTIVAHKDVPYETLYALLKTAGHLTIDQDKGQKPLKFYKFLVLSNT